MERPLANQLLHGAFHLLAGWLCLDLAGSRIAAAGTTSGEFRLAVGPSEQREFCFSLPRAGEVRVEVQSNDPSLDFYAMLSGGGAVPRYLAPGRGSLVTSFYVSDEILAAEGSVWAVVLQPACGRSAASGRIVVTTPDGALRGESELDGWLLAHPTVAHHLRWREGGAAHSYPVWPSEMKRELWRAFERVRAGVTLALDDPPRNTWTFGPGDAADAVHQLLTPDDARALYFATVAQSLVVEIDARVHWSVTELRGEALDALFAADAMFWWNATQGGYEPAEPTNHDVIPPPPQLAYEFLAEQHLLRTTPRETIVALTEWARGLVHLTGGLSLSDFEDHWGYRGAMPVSRALRGTTRRSDSKHAHFTAGCHGTVGTLVSVLRTANVPARGRIVDGHATIEFLSEDLALTHGDDPYNRVAVRAPTEELFIDRATYDAWLGPLADPTNNIGRRTVELGLRYGAPCLVDEHRLDVAEGRSREQSRVYAAFRRIYRLADLESQRLFERLDQEAAAGVTELGAESTHAGEVAADAQATESEPVAGSETEKEALEFAAKRPAIPKHPEPTAMIETQRADVVTIEGESMQVSVSSGQISIQPMAGFAADTWSGDSQLWWTGVGVKELLTAEFFVRESATYRVSARFTRAPDYGRFWLQLDGIATQAGELDLFGPSVALSESILLGEFEFAAGEHRFTALNVGQHRSALPGAMFGLDALELERLRE